MSAWRRRAIELFPALQGEIESPDYTVYMLFFDLLPLVREAHACRARDDLTRIYGFAEWCLSQSDPDLWNASGVAFYEHLFDQRNSWTSVIPWLSPKVIIDCWPLWEARLEMQELAQIRKLLKTRKEHAYRELNAGRPR